MKIKRLPAGFVVPAQPIRASKPPSGADWVHEIKHDGYRLIRPSDCNRPLSLNQPSRKSHWPWQANARANDDQWPAGGAWGRQVL